MKAKLFLLAATVGLTACATTSNGETPPDQAAVPAPPAMMRCDAAPVQSHVGHEATQATGAAILKDSGARTLRWGPPNDEWTMDYREDRVNVRYDETMKITGVTCG